MVSNEPLLLKEKAVFDHVLPNEGKILTRPNDVT